MNRTARGEHHTHTSAHSPQHDHEAVQGSAVYREHEAHAGHDKHAGHSVAMFRDKFWLSFVLTIPTLVWGHMLPHAFGYIPPDFPGSQWIAPAFGTAVFFYGGVPFLK